MIFHTQITKDLGIEHPIIGGTMMDLSNAAFVAAISEAGGLGILATAMFKDAEALRSEIKKVKSITSKPFAVNINLFPMMAPKDNPSMVRVMAEEDVHIVETSGFSAPEELVQVFKEHSMYWMHKCVGVRYAKKVEKMGANAVTVVGYENGGATGKLNTTTMVLVPSVVRAVKIPVIAGGGIVDGNTLLAALALGADAVIVGTRFLLSEECPVHNDLKNALCNASELDTGIIMQSVGFAHRVWLNDPAKKVQELETACKGLDEIYPYVSGESAKKMYDTGDLQAGTVSCSQGVGLINKIEPVKQIVETMVQDARAQLERMSEFMK